MVDKSLFQLSGIRQRMLVLAALSFAQSVCVVAQAVGLTWALVRIWDLVGLGSLFQPTAIFLIAFSLRQLCEVAKQRVANEYADSTVDGLRPRVQAKIFRLGSSVLNSRGTGSSVTVLIDGLDEVRTYLFTLLPKMMDMVFIPLIVLIVVVTQNWLSGVVLLLMMPLLFVFMAILGLAARDRSNKQYAQFRKLNTTFVDTILGLPTLKMLGISEAYEQEIFTVSERFRKRTMSVIKVALTSTFALDFFTTLGIAIMAVFLGNGLIDRNVQLFPALLALILAPEYFLPIRQFGEDYHATLNGKNALDDLLALLKTPEPERMEDLDWPGWGPNSHLTVKDCSFTHQGHEQQEQSQVMKMRGIEEPGSSSSDGDRPNRPALSHLNLSVKGFTKVAVIGRSGAGKSTLINLLAGFNTPQEGGIDLDGNSLRSFNAPAWQRHISYIPQNPYIFGASIADNIRFYDNDADDRQVQEAANKAGLKDWLQTLPQGLQTDIGEGSRGVSGGQAQRIALARILLDKSRTILLFDEPTAHLDIETEYDLKATLLPVMEDHLVVIATHRLHWLADVDDILVLDQGHIVAHGSLDQLLGHGTALDTLVEEMGGNQIDKYLNK